MNTNSSIDEYYNTRKTMNYYKHVLELLHALPLKSILDVGARRSPILESVAHVPDRVSLDKLPITSPHGIRHITHDFYTWTPDKQYDIVTCLQVLEHLDHPKEFAQKLFQVSKRVLLSVPYKWKKGECKYHVQDPVTLAKVTAWVGRRPTAHVIVEDNGKRRLICYYQGVL
jgi:hypothetical protein